MTTEIVLVRYDDPEQGLALLDLLDAYAQDPFGGGTPLRPEVRQTLLAALSRVPGAFSLLAMVDGRAVGLANCFEGFSTFNCAPLVNLHDLMVLPECRGQGLAQQMMQSIEQIAREKGCCKITLEVVQNNRHAQQVYEKMGFSGYRLDADHGDALMWQKKLS